MNDETFALPRHAISPAVQDGMRNALVERAALDSERPKPAKRPVLRGRRTWAVAMGAAAAAVAATVAIGQLSTTPAWASSADRIEGANLAKAQSQCLSHLSRLPNSQILPAHASAIGERRGTTTSVLLTSPKAVGVCIGLADSRYGGIVEIESGSSDRVVTVDGYPQITGDGEATSALFGRLASTSTRVEIQTADDRTIQASVSAGHYLAWWPSGAAATRVTAYDAAGKAVDELSGSSLGTGVPAPSRS